MASQLKDVLAPHQMGLRTGHHVQFLNHKNEVIRAKITSRALYRLNKRDEAEGIPGSKYYTLMEHGTEREFTLNFGGKMGYAWLSYKASDEAKAPSLVDLINEYASEDDDAGFMREITIVGAIEHASEDQTEEEGAATFEKINLSAIFHGNEEDFEKFVDIPEIRALQVSGNALIDKIFYLQEDQLGGYNVASRKASWTEEKELLKKRFEATVEKMKSMDVGSFNKIKLDLLCEHINAEWLRLERIVESPEETMGLSRINESNLLEVSSIPNVGGKSVCFYEDLSRDDDANPTTESTRNQETDTQDQDTVDQLKKEVNDMEAKVRYFKDKLAGSDKEFQELMAKYQKQGQEQENSSNASKAKYESLVSLYTKLQEENAAIKEKFDDLNDRHGELLSAQLPEDVHIEIRTLQQKYEDLRRQHEREIKEAEETKKIQYEELQENLRQITNLSKTVETLNEKLARSNQQQNQLKDQMEPITSLKQENHGLKNENDRLNRDLVKVKADLHLQMSQNQILRDEQRRLLEQNTGRGASSQDNRENHPESLLRTQPQVPQPLAQPSTFVQDQTDVAEAFEKLMIEAEDLHEKMQRDKVKNRLRINNMDTDTIKNVISGRGQESFEKALSQVDDFRKNLKFFQLKSNYGRYVITYEQREAINDEIHKTEV